MKKSLLLAGIAGLLTFASCTKNNVQTFPNNTVDFTVQVVTAGNNSVLKTAGTQGLSGATVSINQNGSVSKVTTDASGLAAFKVQPGSVAVTISASNQTTLDFVTLITIPQTNTGTIPGTTISQSSASVIAALFPTSGTGTATITGYVQANINDTSTAPIQYAPAGTQVNAYLDNSDLVNYVSISGSPTNITISSIVYEGTNFTTTVQANGSYSITVPSAGGPNGLEIDVEGSDFTYNVIQLSGSPLRTIFKGSSTLQRVSTFSGQTTVLDLNYGG